MTVYIQVVYEYSVVGGRTFGKNYAEKNIPNMVCHNMIGALKEDLQEMSTKCYYTGVALYLS